MKKRIFILLTLCSILLSCNNIITEEEVEEDIGEDEMTFVDTLQISEGRIPQKWEKVMLQNGYYIGFPKEPRKKEKGNRADWKLRRNKYELYISLTDLKKEPSFEENKQYRLEYYQVIIEDLAEGIEGEVQEETTFLSQGIYEGKRATIRAEDATVYVQCVIIGTTLYSFGLILYADEKNVYLQMKDKFFHSFGKDLFILEEPELY